MKTVAALISGLLLSMATFVAGLVIALVFLNAGEPSRQLGDQNMATLWTTEPVKIDKASQPFERLPARPAPKAEQVAALTPTSIGVRSSDNVAPTSDPAARSQMVDPVTTGAIDTQQSEMNASRQTWRSTAHAEWCARRYRSYDATDNSYRPYGGGRRSCESPYSTVAAAADSSADMDEDRNTTAQVPEDQPITQDDQPKIEQASIEETSDASAELEHVQSCFARYRSYRPEDNSYQPFDGGARRQCH